MSTMRTARDRARAEVRAEIVATARRHLADRGAADLSLRAVARDLGVVPSAVYRYFDGRDALLTALITEAYDALADVVDDAASASARRRPAARWVAVAHAARSWALDHPQEYALLYGTPIPGYAAPQDTVAPGTRVPRALIELVADAGRTGQIDTIDTDLSAHTRRDLAALMATIDSDVSADVAFRAITAWTQLFGMISFELFNQTRGMVTDDTALFDDAATAMARFVGLRQR